MLEGAVFLQIRADSSTRWPGGIPPPGTTFYEGRLVNGRLVNSGSDTQEVHPPATILTGDPVQPAEAAAAGNLKPPGENANQS
jgi:hypothetical protein